MILWGLNPKGDDAPPLELVLRLDHDTTLLPTCNLDDGRILQQKVLPLTRSNQFLNMITSFAGLIERFTHPDLTLYYTLTRVTDPERSDETGKRVLYITLFDHKERTTRVYARDGTTERFYSTESDFPLIDLRHGLLETKLDSKIISKDDLIAGDAEIHSRLRIHHQSIMDQIHFTIGGAHGTTTITPLPPAYTIENKWTMKTDDTVGARERSRREETVKQQLGKIWRSTVERGQNMEADSSHPTIERDRLYLEHGRIEEMRRSLDAARGRWIDIYMRLVIREIRDYVKGETTAGRRVDGEPAEKEREVDKKMLGGDEELYKVVEEGLIDERCLMEKLLVYEVKAWEGLVWNRIKEFMDRNDVPESGKEQLMREWRGNCWKRLDANIGALDARMERAKVEISALSSNELQRTLNSKLKGVHDAIRSDWKSVIRQLVDTPILAPSSSVASASSLLVDRFNLDVGVHVAMNRELERRSSAAQHQVDRQYPEMARRLKKELADVEFRIAQGLDRCDQFFDDQRLLECRHSRSKLLYLGSGGFNAPLDFYSRALKANNHVIRISFHCYSDQEYAWLAEMMCDLPWVTSIWIDDRERLPPIQRDTPLFIYHVHSPSLQTFLNDDQSLAHTRDTCVFMGLKAIAVSFIGPPSGNLILRLKHHATRPNVRLTILGTSFTLTIPQSLTMDDIELYPIGNSSSQLSFMPKTRNNLILQSSEIWYTLQDVQLLDEDGNPYRQPSQRNIPTSEFDALSTPDDHESS
jgi:hypothetical protein